MNGWNKIQFRIGSAYQEKNTEHSNVMNSIKSMCFEHPLVGGLPICRFEWHSARNTCNFGWHQMLMRAQNTKRNQAGRQYIFYKKVQI